MDRRGDEAVRTATRTACLSDRLIAALDSILILPRRIRLETPGVEATVPMLRGVWGAALHDLDRRIYRNVFDREPDRPVPEKADTDLRVPGYIIRPAPPDPEFVPAMEWILIGDAIRFEPTLRQAWDVASGMGLGPERRRFHLRQTVFLGPDDQPALTPVPWPLSQVVWLARCSPARPCRLVFPAPLRLRRRKRLIESPTLPDLIVAATRRIRMFLPEAEQTDWDCLAHQALEQARIQPARPWQGQRLDLHRYSGRQKAELDLYGVCGCLELPRGPGELWPLLAAAGWIHLGKGTVMGLGQLKVEAG